jgi:hypothetical protein
LLDTTHVYAEVDWKAKPLCGSRYGMSHTVMTSLWRTIYVVLSRGLRQSGGLLKVRHRVSAKNTYPRTCCIQHVLGFTHIFERSRAGYSQLKRKTRRERMRGKLKAVKGELRTRKHAPPGP